MIVFAHSEKDSLALYASHLNHLLVFQISSEESCFRERVEWRMAHGNSRVEISIRDELIFTSLSGRNQQFEKMFEHNDAKSISCLLIHFLPAVRFNTFNKSFRFLMQRSKLRAEKFKLYGGAFETFCKYLCSDKLDSSFNALTMMVPFKSFLSWKTQEIHSKLFFNFPLG